ncbi:hypothetical protein J6TS1_47670 [Siminovitchia terrae]|uniref:Uncharacterized protein n=1 Tax=Siminovitchia terrae TaxID=1914933 RepID=A0ABQ4L3N8_SIMTE|nr:hypothetical protein [Siminovitchia terrae]GIN98897.1 hypothetical protein J6TS1_47670 [Siminovitchia terrae]
MENRIGLHVQVKPSVIVSVDTDGLQQKAMDSVSAGYYFVENNFLSRNITFN